MIHSEIANRFHRLNDEQKLKLIDRLVALGASPSQIPVFANPSQGPLELSFAQERLWFLHELAPDSPVYILHRCLRIKGRLSVNSLQAAVDLLAKKHQSLRMRIGKENGRPYCEILDKIEAPLEIVSLKNKNPADIDSQLALAATRLFDFSIAPLFRVYLFELENDSYIFLLTIHHIISDGLSIDVLVRDLTKAYNAAVKGIELKEENREILYTDYTAWQRAWFSDRLLKKNLDFWEHRLADAPKLSTFLYEFPKQSFYPHSIEFDIDEINYAALQSFVKTVQSTPFNLFLSVLNLLIYRYTDKADNLIGSPTSGRVRPELSELVGLVINTIVLRNKIDIEETFAQFLRRVTQGTLEAFEHQVVPFEKIVQRIGLERELDQFPLFQVLFIFHKGRQEHLQLENLSWEIYPVRTNLHKYPITFEIIELNSIFKIKIDYDPNLYARSTVEGIGRHFKCLCDSVISNPIQKIKNISVLTDSEMHCFHTWNQTKTECPQKTIVQWIEDIARNHSDDPAVACKSNQLSYATLSEQSKRAAENLISKEICPGVGIGVCMTSCIELIPTLLGILRAGCYYIPLDPSFPSKRLEFIIEEARLPCVICQEKEQVMNLSAAIECIEAASLFVEPHESLPLPEIKGSDAAYVMYTSGSTGKPKGILVEHRNLVNVLNSFKRLLDLKNSDRLFSVTTFTFDISALEFFLPLISGACVHIADKQTVRDADALVAEINRVKPSIIQGTPSFWNLLASKEWVPNWRITLLTGGESLTQSLAKYLLKISSCAFNVYGPTETTIWSTYHRLSANDEDILIGRPIDNTEIFILDSSLSQVPIGVIGDLYIGGLGVSRGYLNRPELHADRFLSLPHLSSIGPVFSTKDRAKFTNNGAIKFVGRSDQQIKIRGFRVEIEEIEIQLQQCASVKKAIVTAAADKDDSLRLVAFVEFSDEKNSDCEPCRQFLKERMPAYMMPSQWRAIQKWPLLPNGKVNKAALLLEINMQEQNRINPEIGMSEEEKRLYPIWIKNLKRDGFKIDDNYFDLGGHSLLAVQLVDEIQKEFNQEYTLRALFENPTISKSAYYLRQSALKRPAESLAIESDPIHCHDSFPLTDVQRAYLAGASRALGSIHATSHLYREMFFKGIDCNTLEMAINRLIMRHPALRTIIAKNSMQVVLQDTPFYKVAVKDLAKADANRASESLAAIREEMSHQILKEDVWPLFDIRVTRTSDGDYLHLSFSLLTADAASLNILLEELSQLYQDLSISLPSLSLTFRDYVMHLQKSQASLLYLNSKSYWQDRLDNFSLGPLLPYKAELSTLMLSRVKRYKGTLGSAEWKNLQEIGKNLGVSPTCILITAFSQILRIWTSHPHFSLVLTLFNRPLIHPEILKIVGDFTTVLLFEMPFQEESSFSTLAKLCQGQLFQDLDHRHYNGIQFTQDLFKKGRLKAPIPVVFTSLLGLPSSAKTTHSSHFDNSSVDSYSITQTPQVALDHQAMEKEGTLFITWDVVEEVFPDQLISTIFQSYMECLRLLSENIKRWELSNLQEFQWPPAFHEMLKQRNRKHEWNSYQCLHHGPLAAAIKDPGKIAVVQGDRKLTYREIIQKASRTMRYLLSKDLPRGTLIGILMDKCPEQITASLGILMSGFAYLPIEASLPIGRIMELLNESGCNCLIVNEKRADLLHIEQIVCQDLNPAIDLQEFKPDVNTDPSQLAYVIYTSGSTGAPKGVMVTHQAAMNTIHTVNRRLKVTENDAIYGISSFSFDLSVYDIFGILSVGGTIVLPETLALKDPSCWLKDIKNNQITLWNTVPHFMSMLMQHLAYKIQEKSCLSPLRSVLLSGDSIPVKLPAAIYAAIPHCQVISLGGATEGSIWSIWYDIHKDSTFDSSIPYGFSMENQEVLVLDSKLQERPIWTEGELYIAGAGVADGYWKNQAATDKQFLNHPKYGRLFRTFDLGRYLPDGAIEFRGRMDRQVKLGGFRIELPEIEAKICEYPGVHEAHAVIYQEKSGQTAIHAFLVLCQSKKDLRENSISNLRNEFHRHFKIDLEDSSGRNDAFADRKSYRSFTHDKIGFSEFSDWIASLRQKKAKAHPRLKALYGSAGGLYPVQIYVHIKEDRIQSIDRGNYYYHPVDHQLIKISEGNIPLESFAPNNRMVADQAAFYIFLVGELSLIESHYPSHALHYCQLEAGEMSQLLETESIKTSIGLCQMGNTQFEAFAYLFNCTPSMCYLHGLVGGYADKLEKKQEDSSERILDGLLFPSNEEKKILDFLKEKLPHYMIPSKFHVLNELPITQNGKIDQKALLKRCETHEEPIIGSKSNFASLYEGIEAIWQNILNIKASLSPTTSFFDLGGDSLKIIQLHGELEKLTEMPITIADLFQYSTLEAQNHLLKSKEEKKTPLDQSKLRAEMREKSRRRQLK